MRIIISPAKKMRIDTDSLPWQALPCFLPRTEVLYHRLRELDAQTLQSIWKCSDRIAAQNTERLRTMDLRQGLTPAILAYEGIQYQYMAPGVFTGEQYAYVQEHLRILSGFYGLLRPFDGVTPYRLEMQAQLDTCDAKDLYSYWGNSIAEQLFRESDCIVNLASKEYSRCVSSFVKPPVRFLTCVFGEEQNGRILEKGTMCKMARGEMVRYMAEHQITEPESLRAFDRLNYVFDAARSDDTTYVFIKREARPCSLD